MPRPEKIHAELEKAGADPDFVRFMISREDLDGEYYDRVFGGEDSDSDMDMSDDLNFGQILKYLTFDGRRGGGWVQDLGSVFF